MLATTQRFLDTLRIGHTVVVRADCYPPGAGAPTVLPLLGGAVQMDRTSPTRRTASVQTLASDVGLALDVRALPQGTYLAPWRGVMYGDLTSELVQLGYLRVESVSVDQVDGTAAIELQDRMAQVDDEEFQTPFNAAGLTPTAAITALVQAVFPGIAITVTGAPAQTPLVDTIYESGRAAAIADLAGAVGMAAYFNNQGNFNVRPLPAVTPPGVWTVDAGDHGVLVGATDATDRTDTANGVLVRGQADAKTAPVSALATATGGPFAWGGPYGKVLRVVDSTAVQTRAQAAAAATAALNSQLGLARSITLQSVPNPALQVEDTIKVVFPGGITEYHVVDQLTVPLQPDGAMELLTRELYGGASTRLAFGGEIAIELRGAEVAA